MKKSAIAAAIALMATPALAHTGHFTNGFLPGLEHPLGGLDHVLAMVAVGLWSGLVLPSRIWAGAATFMGAMCTGAAVSWAGVPMPMVETWITLSVVVFGLLTILSRRGQAGGLTLLSLAVIGLFATAHGYAHASEVSGGALAYMAGFLLSTAMLHLVGIGMVRLAAQGATLRLIQRSAGFAVTLGGLWLFAG